MAKRLARKSKSRRSATMAASPSARAKQPVPDQASTLKNRIEELKKTNEELVRERADLRERAGVIEKRYTELMERASRSMRCPRCGGKLEELQQGSVKVDRCSGCAGIFLEKGELEAIVSSKGTTGVLQSLRDFFG